MINIEPVGVVRNSRKEIEDDNWGGLQSKIILDKKYGEESLIGLEEFSHAEIIYYFDRVDENKIVYSARNPRNNESLPKVGIFSQRGKNRPNRLGLTIVKILKRVGNVLYVENLDAADGTPVIDIKPVMKEYLPKEEIVQPGWTLEVMKNYWNNQEPTD